MPELMRDDAYRNTDFIADLMEIIAELSNERLFAARSRQEEAIVGKWFQRTKEAQPLNEFGDERIHRYQFVEMALVTCILRFGSVYTRTA